MAGPPSPEEKSPASLQGPGSDSSHHLGAVQTAEIRPEKAHLGNPELDALLSGTFMEKLYTVNKNKTMI